MKRTTLIWATLLLLPGLGNAQGGAICLYADPNGANCGFEDNAPGLLKIYVLHTLSTSVTTSQFSAPKPSCMVGATWLDDTNPFPAFIGDSQTGISIGYGYCVTGPTHILTLNYVVSGTSLPDCPYPVLPHPAKNFIEATDCIPEVIAATGGTSYINSSLHCQCEELPRSPFLEVSIGGMGFGETDTIREFEIRNIGAGELTWSLTTDVAWMSVSPTSGSGDATAITVTADRSWLDPGTHLGSIFVESNGGNETMLVSIVIPGPPPPPPPPPGIYVWVNPDTLYFGLDGTQRTFMIKNYRGEGQIAWDARVSVPWLSVAPVHGSAKGNASRVTVYIDRTRLGPGDRHETTIVIGTSNGDRLDLNPTIAVRVDGRRETTTATHHSTWGYVKALYRD